MKDINAWVRSVQDYLSRLKDLDLGYPLDTNEVLAPQQPNVVEHGLRAAQANHLEELKTFYTSCDGVSLPDVHVGYFIKSITRLGIVDPFSEPSEITGEFAGKVLSFGSTGGGGLFVLKRGTGDVLHLAPGPLEDGVYDGTRGKVKSISRSFFDFLDNLGADIQAFVENRTRHRFMC
jgi:hypothetical protein